MTAIDLDQQLVELRSAADAYAARHKFIPDLTWPEGVRIAVNFTCDFDAMLLRRLLDEPSLCRNAHCTRSRARCGELPLGRRHVAFAAAVPNAGARSASFSIKK